MDPKYPDAHRDPPLRAYLERQAEKGIAALVRYSAGDGFTLFAPALASDGQWHEMRGLSVESSHSPVQRAVTGRIV